jgi:site-specific DNA-methyltransferase (adenine-specific)
VTPYYDDGQIQIWHGDCRDVLPSLADSSIDLVLTDPPYEHEAHTPMRRTRASIEGRAEIVSMPFGVMTEALRAEVVRESIRIGRGWSLVFCQAEAVGIYHDLYGDLWRRPMVWIKPDSSPQFTGDRPAMGYESICSAWVGEGRSRWNGGGLRGVFTYNCTDFERFHPTQKPVTLTRRLIDLFSNPGDLILDMFGGSGTTARAAKDLGRRCILIELDEQNCETAVARLSQQVIDLTA